MFLDIKNRNKELSEVISHSIPLPHDADLSFLTPLVAEVASLYRVLGFEPSSGRLYSADHIPGFGLNALA